MKLAGGSGTSNPPFPSGGILVPLRALLRREQVPGPANPLAMQRNSIVGGPALSRACNATQQHRNLLLIPPVGGG